MHALLVHLQLSVPSLGPRLWLLLVKLISETRMLTTFSSLPNVLILIVAEPLPPSLSSSALFRLLLDQFWLTQQL